MSVYECLFGASPSFDNIHIFGCLSYARLRDRTKDKFGPRSTRCVFVGYPFGQKGWKLYDLDNKEIFVSRDVKFFEEIFPFYMRKNKSFAERGEHWNQIIS